MRGWSASGWRSISACTPNTSRSSSAVSTSCGVPLVTISGLQGRNIDKLMPAVVKVYKDWTAKVKTGDLNRWLRHTVEHHPPPSVQGKRITLHDPVRLSRYNA